MPDELGVGCSDGAAVSLRLRAISTGSGCFFPSLSSDGSGLLSTGNVMPMPDVEALECADEDEVRRSSDNAPGCNEDGEMSVGSGVVAGVLSSMVPCSTAGNAVFGRDEGVWGGECGRGDCAVYCDAGASVIYGVARR